MAKVQTTMTEAEMFALMRDHPFDDFLESMTSLRDPNEIAHKMTIELIKDLSSQKREAFLENLGVAARAAAAIYPIYYESVKDLGTYFRYFMDYWFYNVDYLDKNSFEFTGKLDRVLNDLSSLRENSIGY